MNDDGSVCLISLFSVCLCFNEISVGSIQKTNQSKFILLSQFISSLKALKVIKKTKLKSINLENTFAHGLLFLHYRV